jgi:hypothetical protein
MIFPFSTTQRFFFSFFVVLLLTGHSFLAAQLPGGVNTVSGNDSLLLWHKAGDISNQALANSTANWPAASGFGANSSYEGGFLTYYEVFKNFNYNTGVRINDERFDNNLNINNLDQVNVFSVYRPLSNGNAPVWGNGKSGGNGDDKEGRQLTLHNVSDGDNNYNDRPDYYHAPGNTRSQQGQLYINHVSFDETTTQNPKNIYINGANVFTLANNKNTTANANKVNAKLLIGNRKRGQLGAGNIQLAEFIVYAGKMSAVQRQKVTSYLAIKYGITLPYNYLLANGDVAWDHAAAGGTSAGNYNHNIVGVGYDANPAQGDGSLQQDSSTSQRGGDHLELYTDPSTFFSGNTRRILIAGHNAATTTTATAYNPTSGSAVSGLRIDRVWRTQLRGGYNNYTLKFRGINLPAGFTGNDKFLVVADDPNFTNNVETYPLTFSNGAYHVSGMMLGTGNTTKYFSIGIETFYTNNDPNAPVLFEACANSSVTFHYDGWSADPTEIRLNSTTGGQVVTVATNRLTVSSLGAGTNGGVKGTVTFAIPDDAATGFVEFVAGGNSLHNTAQPLTIHNPIVDFLPQVSPLCATDSVINLYGFPNGGTFASSNTSLNLALSGNTLDARKVGWTLNHDSAITASVDYSYRAQYSDGTLCHTPKTATKPLTFYDNRLFELEFRPFIKEKNVPNYVQLTLDTTQANNIISEIEPNIFCDPSNFCYPYDFTGTFVNASDTLLADQAPFRNAITLQFDNNGCIGKITADLDIYEPLNIAGLPDTLCIDADSLTFYRDPALTYSDTTISNIRYVNNQVIGATTIDPTQSSAIQVRTLAGGSESFALIPSNISGNPSELVVVMQYANRTINNTVGPPIISADTFLAIDTVILTQRPNLSFTGIQSAYCAYGTPDTIVPIPAFEYRSRTYFTLTGADSAGVYNLPSQVFQDSLIIPDTVYNALVPNANRDLPMRLRYVVDRYGCLDDTTHNFTIRAPLQPSFLAKAAYCRNEPPSLLQRNVLTGGVSESWVPALGLDTATGSFDPVIAGAGDIPVTYVLTDQFNCSYGFTDTLFVRQPPLIEMTLDGSRTNTQFCANPISVALRSRLLVGNLLDSVEYFGAGVIDSTFNPNSVFSGGGGTSIIWSEATDAFGCKGYDTLRVTIVQAPSIDIDSVFNNMPSNYGAGNNLRAEHTYCKSDAAFQIDGRPSYREGRPGVISGLGVKLINADYYYDPTLIGPGVEVDTVRYTYTDSIGCINTDLAIVKLDSIPVVSLNGFVDTNFCPNYDTVQLLGIPDVNVAQGTALYSGPGVNPNSGIFTPSTAGTGRKSIIYQFIDSKGCEDSDTVDILVNPLPIPSFTGYQYQYCTADSADRLWSLNDTTTGTYYFYGAIIVDSIGILDATDSTTGPQPVYYAYVDSNNCTNVDSVNVFIHPTPDIQIYGLDSAYCYDGPSDIITVVPAGSGGSLISSDTAFSTGVNTIILRPNLGNPGIKTFTYGYTDNNGCANNITARTYVHRPNTPTVTGLDLRQCATNDTIPIYGSRSWGRFVGAGIFSDTLRPIDSMWYFIPSATNIGIRTVSYTVDDTLTSHILTTGDTADLVCPAELLLNVNVRPLPNPKFWTPANNTRFCSNDSIVELRPDSLNPVWHAFRDTTGGVSYTTDSIYIQLPNGLFRLEADTTYYFDPGLVGAGVHSITYIATDTGSYCEDSIQLTYIVDQYIEVDFGIDSVYCASNSPVLLNGTPAGGLFIRNDSILNPNRNSPYFYFDSTLTTSTYDTLTYAIEYGACSDTLTKLILTHPIPAISFTTVNYPHNTYCLGGDDVVLNTTIRGTTTVVGGDFNGSPGVLAGQRTFVPDLAGVGSHLITFNYTDSSTQCANVATDTLHVYGMPNVDFAVAGGCQYDTVYFEPNNVVLNLNNKAQNRVIDSITHVQWVFSPTYTAVGSSQSSLIDSNLVDTIGYRYDTAGVYMTQLIVANREYCIDTQTVRLVISPKVSSFPYEQDFENAAGDWYAESRDSSHRLLWEWGIDSTTGGPSDRNNHLWATQTNAPYEGGEDAWVYSPCFDLSSLNRPMISFDYWTDTRTSVDGAVLEYQREDGTWAPVGFMNRGVDWFNSPFISGQPGDQFAANLLGTGWTAPLGWSGKDRAWQNGRYKLDDFRGPDNTLRMRMAFASPAIQPNAFYDGFAFDNVIVRNRTRNVLLETMANISFADMEIINNQSYNLVFHTTINKDVVLLQYHIESPNNTDAMYQNNPQLGRNRSYEYSGSPAGRAFIDGDNSGRTYLTYDLTDADFEQDMLATPKFSVTIDTFTHINSNFNVRATVTALENMPNAEYRIYTVISEDSLFYPTASNYRSQLHAIARENDQLHLDPAVNTTHIYTQPWSTSETKTIDFNWNHASHNFIIYNYGRFQAVVFIQNLDTKEVFQVASTRDISGYWVGIDPIAAESELNEIQTVNLFPNPAHDYFNLKFDQALDNDYQWRLVDIRGVEVKQGQVARGTEQVTIDGLGDCAAGTYILVLHNNKVFTQRKVVLGRP